MPTRAGVAEPGHANPTHCRCARSQHAPPWEEVTRGKPSIQHWDAARNGYQQQRLGNKQEPNTSYREDAFSSQGPPLCVAHAQRRPAQAGKADWLCNLRMCSREFRNANPNSETRKRHSRTPGASSAGEGAAGSAGYVAGGRRSRRAPAATEASFNMGFCSA